MSAFVQHRYVARMAGLLLAGLALSFPADSLELWTDDPPRIPDGATRTIVTRSVTHRDGREIPAITHPHLRRERLADGAVRQVVYDDQGGYLWTTTFETENGRLASIRALVDDQFRWQMRFDYDELGRPVRESYLGALEQPERTITYEYAGELVEIVSYRNDGSVSWRRTETAGLDVDRRETTFYYPDGSRVKTIVASVDVVGRAVSEKHLDELGSVYRAVEREYSDAGIVGESVRDESGDLIRRTRWLYDPAGVLVERVIELPHERVTERLTIAYSSNDRSDWIRQERTSTARFGEAEPVVTDREILRREIEYE